MIKKKKFIIFSAVISFIFLTGFTIYSYGSVPFIEFDSSTLGHFEIYLPVEANGYLIYDVDHLTIINTSLQSIKGVASGSYSSMEYDGVYFTLYDKCYCYVKSIQNPNVTFRQDLGEITNFESHNLIMYSYPLHFIENYGWIILLLFIFMIFLRG